MAHKVKIKWDALGKASSSCCWFLPTIQSWFMFLFTPSFSPMEDIFSAWIQSFLNELNKILYLIGGNPFYKTKNRVLSWLLSKVILLNGGVWVWFQAAPSWPSDKESTCHCRRCKRLGFDSWVKKIPGEGNGNPLRVLAWKNPTDGGAWRATYSPGGIKELDVTERMHTHTHTHTELTSTFST